MLIKDVQMLQVFFRKADDLEGIDTSHVPSKRWLSTCCVCKSNGGACVDCTEIGCKASFHVSCALKKDLALEFRKSRNGAIVISFCPEHTAAWDEVLPRALYGDFRWPYFIIADPRHPLVDVESPS